MITIFSLVQEKDTSILNTNNPQKPRDMKTVKRLLFVLIILALSETAFAQLTGEWTDNNGACYKVREVDNRVYWSMDESPKVLNVFAGLKVGDIINGRWADVPGGSMMGNGSLSLRVESNDRMVKINQTGNYGASVFTRESCDCPFKSSPFPYEIELVVSVDNRTELTRIGTGNQYAGIYYLNNNEYARRTERIWLGGEDRIMIETVETSDGWRCTFTGAPDCKFRGDFNCSNGGQTSSGSFSLIIK